MQIIKRIINMERRIIMEENEEEIIFTEEMEKEFSNGKGDEENE